MYWEEISLMVAGIIHLRTAYVGLDRITDYVTHRACRAAPKKVRSFHMIQPGQAID